MEDTPKRPGSDKPTQSGMPAGMLVFDVELLAIR